MYRDKEAFLAKNVQRFTSIDPHAERYYSISPYVYVVNNPLKYIDPTGKDYWSTNDPKEIERFLSAVKSHTGAFEKFEFSSWETHLTDNEFLEGMKELGNLTFDDEAGIFYSSEASIENGQIVVNGYSYSAEFIFDKMASLSTGIRPQSGRLDVMGADDPLFLGLAIGRALFSGGAKAVTTIATPKKTYSEATYESFKRILQRDGRRALERSKSKIERRLLEHQDKLPNIKYKSSVEREINTFKSQLDAINDILKGL